MPTTPLLIPFPTSCRVIINDGDDDGDGDDGDDGNDGDDGDGLEDYGDRAAFPGWVVRESESRV